MLSLFKEPQVYVSEPWSLARIQLISFLNKGMIPDWESFLSVLPVFEDVSQLEMVKTRFETLLEWTFLKDILDFEGNEYFFHSVDCSQVLFPAGEKKPIQVPLDKEDWQLWLEIISLKFKQNWNVENPFASFYGRIFGRNYRLSLVHSACSPVGTSKLVMRHISEKPHILGSFGETEALLEKVLSKKNILIAGSTGSGKTSLLSSLLNQISQNDHLAILEDTYEIQTSHPYATRFLAGQTDSTSLKSYLSYCLRLSPDRIILGEMRSHEVIPFMMAMNTGHRGLMATIHASSAYDAINRVALLFTLYSGEATLNFERVIELLCRNMEYVVFMKDKKVKEVIRILGADKGVAFYETLTL